MPAHVAPGSKNILLARSLRLCVLEPKAPLVHPKDQRSACEQWLSAVELAVLEEGYVILMPLGDGQSSVPPTAESAILARTDPHGTMLWIEEAEIADDVPTGADRTVIFTPGVIYSYFWTRSAELADYVWEDVQTSPERALEQHLFSTFTVADDPLRALPQMLHLGERARTKLAMLIPRQATHAAPSHGVVSGLRLSSFGVERVDANAAYVIGRSEALSAMFLAGLFPSGVADAVRENLDDWLTIEGSLDIVHSGLEGIRLPAVDADLGSVDNSGQTLPSGPWNEAYRTYAFECARARVPRESFWAAINMFANQDGWKAAADHIRREYKVRVQHPAYSDAGFRPDQFPKKFAVLRYFDFYDFAFRNQHEPWIDGFAVAKAALASQDERARLLAQKTLDTRGRYDRFMMELGAHVADNETRKALHDQYLTVAVQSRHEWWSGIPPVGDDAGWARFGAYGQWIGTLSSKLGDLMKAHFGDPLQVARYNALLKQSINPFRLLFGNLQNFDRYFAGKTVKRKYENLTFRADFENCAVIIEEKDEHPHKIGPIQFLVELEEVQHTQTAKLPPLNGSRQARYKQVIRTTSVGRATLAAAPFKEIHSWPSWLSAFGNTVSLAFQLHEVSEQWKNEPSNWSKLLMAGKVAEGAFQFIDSVSAAVSTILKRSTPLTETLGRAGNMLEAATNVVDGVLILLEQDEGRTAAARARGDAVEVRIRQLRGAAYILSAVPGPVALAFPKLVASEWLGIGLAYGGIVILAIDMFLFSHSGPDDAMAGTAAQLANALKRELGGGMREGRTAHDVSAMLDELQQLGVVSG
jgi:hypothetical protein